MNRTKSSPEAGCAIAGQSFPKAMRVRRRREFVRVQRRGSRVKARHLIALYVPCSSDHPRVGFTVSKKVGNAVKRNRVKRWLREAVRTVCRPDLPSKMDVVLIARSSAVEAGWIALVADVRRLLRAVPGPRLAGHRVRTHASQSSSMGGMNGT